MKREIPVTGNGPRRDANERESRPLMVADVRGESVGRWVDKKKQMPSEVTVQTIVCGSYRDGKWSVSSSYTGKGWPIWGDEDRTHWTQLPPPPHPEGLVKCPHCGWFHEVVSNADNAKAKAKAKAQTGGAS